MQAAWGGTIFKELLPRQAANVRWETGALPVRASAGKQKAIKANVKTVNVPLLAYKKSSMSRLTRPLSELSKM